MTSRSLALAVVLWTIPGSALAAPLDTTLVSRASGGAGAKGNGGSGFEAISATGRFVAFESSATNLSRDDAEPHRDIYRRDRSTGVTTLVSRATGPNGDKAKGSTRRWDSSFPAISADGRFVAFDSEAVNLSADDGDARADIFVRDLLKQTTTLVSRASGAAGAKGDGRSSRPAISADGGRVAFASGSANLDGKTGGVFVRDLRSDTTTLVSRASGAAGAPANGASQEAAISADGRYIAFNSLATNLSPADAGPVDWDVYVRDLQTNTTELVSRAAGVGGAKGDGWSLRPAISADGRLVAFDSAATNLNPDDGDAVYDVFVRDRQSHTTTLVSRAPGATGVKGDGDSNLPVISDDGRLVGFDSRAANLAGDDTDGYLDVFVRDLVANTTTLVSRASGAAGAKANHPLGSLIPAIAGNGEAVAFLSTASNLSPADTDNATDVYVRELAVSAPQQVPARAAALRRARSAAG
jgi:Tol biopolymer transport system component